MVGTVGKRGRKRLLTVIAAAAALTVAIALTPMTASAVHSTGLFELDGNIVDDGTPGVDWATFQNAGGSALETAFVSDGFNGQNDDIYFQGGSQNNNDIPSWAWSCGSVSTKSDIEHAFASAYLSAGELILYFGADRYDPTGGTTNIGFWFLQGGGALTGGTGCPDLDATPNTFSGKHVDGDLFVFAEFTGGGGDSAVSLYEWRNGTLNLLFSKTASSFCNGAVGSIPADTVCAQTNTGTITSTWPYTDNQGSSTDGNILTGGFVEGGINLSDLYAGLGKEIPCVNRFLAQTGSSHPDTGVLEDFAGGAFDICSKLIVDKVTNPSGEQQTFQFNVTGPNSYSQSFSLADATTPFDSGQIKSGTYNVNETPGDSTIWNAPTVVCKDQNDNTVTYGAGGAVNIGPGQTVTCTFTNVRKSGTVKVVKDFQGTPTSVGLQVDGSTKATVTADGETPVQTVLAGTSHTAGEVFTNGDGANYTTTFACTRNGSALSSGSALTTPSFTVNGGDAVVCTYTNTRKAGKIELKKDFVGTPDNVTLNIGTSAGGNQVDTQALSGDGSTGENTVDTGTYFVNESLANSGNYTTTLSCFVDTDNDSIKQAGESARSLGANDSVAVGNGEDVVCEYVNTRKSGKIELQKDFVGTADNVTLRIGTAQGGSQVDSQALSGDGTTGENTVDSGTYYVSESLSNSGNYNSTLSCFVDTNNDSIKQAGEAVRAAGGDGSVVVNAGEDIVCVFVNTRKLGKIELQKDWQGTAGSVTLSVKSGSTTVASGTANGQDGTTGETTVDTGAYTMNEAFTSGVQADYNSTLTCTDTAAGHSSAGLPNNAAYAAGDAPSVQVDEGDDIVCVITNARKRGKIELAKDWVGTAGSVDLAITQGVTTIASGTANGQDGSTGETAVDTGSYVLHETFTAGTQSQYTSTLACVDTAQGHSSAGLPNGGAYQAGQTPSVQVDEGDDIVCTITNNRRQGQIELVKDFVGTADNVTLNIGTAAGGSQIDTAALTGDGTTGPNAVNTGTYYVSESLANAGNYNTTLSCFVDANNDSIKQAGEIARTVGADGAVDVGTSEDVVCVFVNTRKLGKIELKKDWQGTAGSVDLAITQGQTTVKSGSANGQDGTTGEATVDTGSYTLNESFTAGSQSDYNSSLTCVDTAEGHSNSGLPSSAPFAAGDKPSVQVDEGDDIVCTITNARKQSKIELVKDFVGTTDDVTLKIGTAAGGSQIDSAALSGDGTTGENPVDTGTYYVSESLTNAGDYNTALSCFVDTNNDSVKQGGEFAKSVGQDGSVAVGEGEDVVCVFVNTRKLGKIELAKDWVGTAGSVNLTITQGQNTAASGTANGQDGSTGETTVDTGSFDLHEAFTAGNQGQYNSTLTCVDTAAGHSSAGLPSNAAFAAGNTPSVPVDEGDDIVCTITNTRKTGTIVVAKHFVGTPTSIDLKLDGTTKKTVTADGQTDPITVDTGDHTAAEGFPLDNGKLYDSTFACTNKGEPIVGKAGDGRTVGVTVGAGDEIVCTFTNTRKPASILVTKTPNPTTLPEPGGPVTYTVTVKNTSPTDDVTITAASFTDSVSNGPKEAISNIDCNGATAGDGLPELLSPNEEMTCTFVKTVSGNAGDVVPDTVEVTGKDESGNDVKDHDDASVEITDVLPAIDVQKTIRVAGSEDAYAENASLPEPGGDFQYKVVVTNGSSVEALTLSSLTDVPYGDLDGKGTCDVPQTLPPSGTYECTFTATFTSEHPASQMDTVTASGHDDDDNNTSDTDTATAHVTDTPSSIDVQKDAGQESVQEPGGDVTFTVTVKNTSAVDTVTITSLVDDMFGDLDGKGTCDVPQTLAKNGGTYTCQFVGHVTGSGGGTHVNTVIASGHDDDENPVSDDDDATVKITSAPPPPHQPLIDLAVTKNDTPDPATLNGQITYTMVVTNNGPDTATGVTAADPLPAGTSFVSVSTTQGTCANNAGLIQCSIGTLAKGASATITLVVTATQTGTITNTVTVVGKEPESNTANNTATATTLVPAPLVPPKPKPKPPVVCYTFTVSSKTLTVGKKGTLVVTVRNRGKAVRGATVVVSGQGIKKTAKTGKDGKARITITPKKAGIITIRVPQTIVCGARRVGVVGAFEPPVTG
jgi:uncharacterized repeat protein (TIGR01451 family)